MNVLIPCAHWQTYNAFGEKCTFRRTAARLHQCPVPNQLILHKKEYHYIHCLSRVLFDYRYSSHKFTLFFLCTAGCSVVFMQMMVSQSSFQWRIRAVSCRDQVYFAFFFFLATRRLVLASIMFCEFFLMVDRVGTSPSSSPLSSSSVQHKYVGQC